MQKPHENEARGSGKAEGAAYGPRQRRKRRTEKGRRRLPFPAQSQLTQPDGQARINETSSQATGPTGLRSVREGTETARPRTSLPGGLPATEEARGGRGPATRVCRGGSRRAQPKGAGSCCLSTDLALRCGTKWVYTEASSGPA